MVKHAHELKYHFITAPQAHAEAQLVQFLHSEHAYRDTVPVAIGWSNQVCNVCWGLYEALWGMNLFPLAEKRDEVFAKQHGDRNWFFPQALMDAVSYYLKRRMRDEESRRLMKEWLANFCKEIAKVYHGDLVLSNDVAYKKRLKGWMRYVWKNR